MSTDSADSVLPLSVLMEVRLLEHGTGLDRNIITWFLWTMKPAARMAIKPLSLLIMLLYSTTLKTTSSPEGKDNSPPEVGKARASERSVQQLSGEVTPLPVEPMGPMTSKNMNGFQLRESNYFLVPVFICLGLHIFCSWI